MKLLVAVAAFILGAFAKPSVDEDSGLLQSKAQLDEIESGESETEAQRAKLFSQMQATLAGVQATRVRQARNLCAVAKYLRGLAQKQIAMVDGLPSMLRDRPWGIKFKAYFEGLLIQSAGVKKAAAVLGQKPDAGSVTKQAARAYAAIFESFFLYEEYLKYFKSSVSFLLNRVENTGGVVNMILNNWAGVGDWFRGLTAKLEDGERITHAGQEAASDADQELQDSSSSGTSLVQLQDGDLSVMQLKELLYSMERVQQALDKEEAHWQFRNDDLLSVCGRMQKSIETLPEFMRGSMGRSSEECVRVYGAIKAGTLKASALDWCQDASETVESHDAA